MKGESREIWEERYATWKDSGLTIAEFSRQNGLKDRSFGRWVRKLSNPGTSYPKKKRSFVALPAMKASSPGIQIRIAPSGEIIIEVHTG